MTARLVVSAGSSHSYYGYYLDGLAAVYPDAGLAFAVEPLPPLRSARDGLAVLTPDGFKLYFAADDHATVDEAALDWCDAYGQINVDPSSPRDGRVVALGPGFGIRPSGLVRAMSSVVRASHADRAGLGGTVSRVRALVRHHRDRQPLAGYVTRPSEPDYLFLLATEWQRYPAVNERRAQLIRALRGIDGLRFEGGLVSGSRPAVIGDVGWPSMSLPDYLARVGASVAAINTPAVHDCLGWKLGEYLALGKAIVSLPLTRVLPGDPEPDEIMFVAAGDDEIVESVVRLRADDRLRRALEARSRHYFDTVVAPEPAVRRVLATARRKT